MAIIVARSVNHCRYAKGKVAYGGIKGAGVKFGRMNKIGKTLPSLPISVLVAPSRIATTRIATTRMDSQSAKGVPEEWRIYWLFGVQRCRSSTGTAYRGGVGKPPHFRCVGPALRRRLSAPLQSTLRNRRSHEIAASMLASCSVWPGTKSCNIQRPSAPLRNSSSCCWSGSINRYSFSDGRLR